MWVLTVYVYVYYSSNWIKVFYDYFSLCPIISQQKTKDKTHYQLLEIKQTFQHCLCVFIWCKNSMLSTTLRILSRRQEILIFSKTMTKKQEQREFFFPILHVLCKYYRNRFTNKCFLKNLHGLLKIKWKVWEKLKEYAEKYSCHMIKYNCFL